MLQFIYTKGDTSEMKKIVLGLICVLVLMGCSSKSKLVSEDNSPKTNEVDYDKFLHDYLYNK